MYGLAILICWLVLPLWFAGLVSSSSTLFLFGLRSSVSVSALLSFRGISQPIECLNETLRILGVLRMKFWGGFLVIVGSISFIGFVFVAIVSKLFPLSDNPIIQAIQNDRYYCFLAPLTLPALLVAVYFHWLSMKLFKHA